MLQSDNIQTFLALTGEMMQAWIVIPDRQQESRFLDHKQFVHLFTICDMFVRNSMRKYWNCKSKTLFYLYENFGSSSYYERLERTEWAKEAILNHSCTQSCANCPELSKSRRQTKIECRFSGKVF